MKRFVLTCLLCTAGLGLGAVPFLPLGSLSHLFVARAAPATKEQLIKPLLALPAPPPPNPLEQPSAPHDASFYDPQKPPPDDAPIADLVDYWTQQSRTFGGVLNYHPRPSDRVLEKLLQETDLSTITNVLNVLPDDRRTADAIKALYDGTQGAERNALKEWLVGNSPYFSDMLTRKASRLRDTDNYVNVADENALLALTRQDFDAARPTIDRLYSDNSQPVSKALATWALYRHAMDVGDVGDTDRYRSELMRMVENRSLSDGTRDMANDAIVREPDFPGRDDWCFSLYADESLVKMPYFTGLTTLMMYAPPGKYTPKMIELLKSDDKLVRLMAVRNLVVALDRDTNPDVVRALLPWLEDPKWAEAPADDAARQRLVNFLQNNKMPESVPGLIAALNEKRVERETDPGNANSANTANTMRYAGNLANLRSSSMIANAVAEQFSTNSNSNTQMTREVVYFPLRDVAVHALAYQGDARAVPALRRLLNEAAVQANTYSRSEILRAILLCGGFTISEQVDDLEHYARGIGELPAGPPYPSANVNSYYIPGIPYSRPGIDGNDTEAMVGEAVAALTDVSDALAHATIDRIDRLSSKEPEIALALRRIVVNWKGTVISALLLNDVKNDRAESAAVLRLLAERKLLREKLSQDVYDLNSGTPTAKGLAACFLEDSNAYDIVLKSESADAKMALFACGRLVRARLPVAKAAEYTKSPNTDLREAAELYLESEDSPEARAVVLGLHPGEAKVLGATYCFKGQGSQPEFSPAIFALFASVNAGAGSLYQYSPTYQTGLLEKTETRLQKEVKDDAGLLGVYEYDSTFIRIYKDRAMLSWEDDPSRYHERQLTTEEFAGLKSFFAANHVAEMKPFLACRIGGCSEEKELLMLSRNGGSRIFVRTTAKPAFFSGLEKIFAEIRAEPAPIKYALGKDVPGLQILFANDDLDAQTVWKQGNDLRLVVSNKSVREKVEAELEDNAEDEEDDEGPDTEEAGSPANRIRLQRQYEGYSWRRLEGGRVTEEVAQPPGVEFIPPADDLAVPPSVDQWKARAAGVEIRANDSGLFKVTSGRLVKLKEGQYSHPIVSANGQWLVANHFDENEGPSLTRINLQTGREYKADSDEYRNLVPKAYVSTLGKFLLGYEYEYEGPDESDEPDGIDTVRRPSPPFYLLDPETGRIVPAVGDVRALLQQTFRPLQSTGQANEYWAAIPSRRKNETEVGKFDARTLSFKSIIRLPKITFDSMDMWVDAAGSRICFVYNGHLLSVPFTDQPRR